MIRAALLLLLLAGCAAPAQHAGPAHQAPQRWAAVLVAGDGSIPVFDNATGRMATLLEAVGTSPADIHRLSAAPDMLAQPHVQLASKAQVLDVIASLHPAPGQACFVLMTSHGAHGPGVFLAPHHEFLSPADLDRALDAGCGDTPTVAIVSACYTGNFAQAPMTRPNRIVLTAAAATGPRSAAARGRTLHSTTSACCALLAACRTTGLTWSPTRGDASSSWKCTTRNRRQTRKASSATPQPGCRFRGEAQVVGTAGAAMS